jgi:nicotinate-nucleotide adenylyltransferase
MISRIENIGILGGTFDPVHNGHLHIARRSSELFSLDRVYFVPAQIPPHKRGEAITNPYHRFAMLALALCDQPHFLASPVELEPGASPFTVDTLADFAQRLRLPPRRLFFIAGGDSFQCVPTWKNFEALLCTYNMLFIERPDCRMAPESLELPERVRTRIIDLRHLGPSPALPDGPGEGRQKTTQVYLLQLDAPDIASTTIRNRSWMASENRSLVPEAVADYIHKHQLYTT